MRDTFKGIERMSEGVDVLAPTSKVVAIRDVSAMWHKKLNKQLSAAMAARAMADGISDRRSMKLQRMANALAPFAYGTKAQEVVIQSQQWVPNSQLQFLLPKSGYIAQVQLLIGGLQGGNGTVDVTAAGSAGSPELPNLFSRYSLNVSFGYEFRGMTGDSLYFANQVREPVIDRVTQSPLYQNYDPTSATTQPISMVLKDEIFMDEGIDFDMFLIPYQSYAKQVYLVLTTGALSAIAANTETLSTPNITITPIITYFSQPDTSKFGQPDTSQVQQILDEVQFQNRVIAGRNVIPLTPINGPEFIGLGFKLNLNGTNDPANFATNLNTVRLLANSTVVIGEWTAASLIQYAFEHYSRKLPAGWFYFPFSDDISLVNAMGPAQRNVFDTKEYTQLDLEVNINSGATVGAANFVKLWKRLQSQAVAA